ncbi:hypothetical protein RCIA138 [Methanocella arvoryzae MRE50]|uniref:Uncharacterized protein n=1 Tax=Methanocella arvoryzae (strain DSM 22066 / NBRC 105507 / MRE50) TaxID=351160 RepID=Q0W3W3_METAR|nr:hypothetical protein RCIA138 [Methanocella arvoryzae MRE50]
MAGFLAISLRRSIIKSWPCVSRKYRQARQGAKLAKLHIDDRCDSDLKSPWRAWLLGVLGGPATPVEITAFSRGGQNVYRFYYHLR